MSAGVVNPSYRHFLDAKTPIFPEGERLDVKPPAGDASLFKYLFRRLGRERHARVE